MGIQGLLPLLKPAHEWKQISEYEGKTLAVDAYVWLHKGAFGCAEDLVMGRKTTKFVNYCMHKVRLLVYHGVTPYIVFDGGPLPAKAGTETERLEKREAAKAKAIELKKAGFAREAEKAFTACVDVTPEMAFQFIKALRAEDIPYVVAPYEADAQLIYLEAHNYVDGILTEDSDLLVFGAKTVLFKMDGEGKVCEVKRERFGFGPAGGGGLGRSEWRMDGWGDAEFRHMAILSGCDYLPSIHGIGLKTSHSLLRKYKSLPRILQHLRMEGYTVPSTYAETFRLAELTFLHQRVFDPSLKKLVTLTPLPEGCGEVEDNYIGPDIDGEVAAGIATGDRCPVSKTLLVDTWTDFKPVAVKMAPKVKSTTTKVQAKIDSMFKLAPKPSQPSPSGTLRRTVSAPQARKITNALTKSTQLLHSYAFGGANSGPSRLSLLPAQVGTSQLSSTARDKLKEVVPESQILEEVGPAPVAKSKFFGKKTAVGKSASDEPKSYRSLLSEVDEPDSLLARVDHRSSGVLPSSSTNGLGQPTDSQASSSVSLTPFAALSGRSPSPSLTKGGAVALDAADDIDSSPPRAHNRQRSPGAGFEVSSDNGYISSSPAGGRTAGLSTAARRPPGPRSPLDLRDGVGPSSDETINGLDLRAVCHAQKDRPSPPSAMLQFAKPEDVKEPMSDSSNIRSDDEDLVDEEEERAREVERKRQTKTASIAAGWRDRFSLKKGGRTSLPGLGSAATPLARQRPPLPTSAPAFSKPLSPRTNTATAVLRPFARQASVVGGLRKETPRSVIQPPRFDLATQLEVDKENSPTAVRVATTSKTTCKMVPRSPSKLARPPKRKSEAFDDAPDSLAAPSRPTKRSSLGASGEVGGGTTLESSWSSSSDGVDPTVAPLSSGSRSRLERLRFKGA